MKKIKSLPFVCLFLFFCLSLQPVSAAMWINGSVLDDQAGSYGIKGVYSPLNTPGGRFDASAWTHPDGTLLLFGGRGLDSNGSGTYLNDLWRFDGSEWRWETGSDSANQYGNYGTLGIPDANNVPGARYKSCSWVNQTGQLWLFGGSGYDTGTFGRLNDLWVYDGSKWMWVGGSNTVDQAGVYGTMGVADAANWPGSRQGCICWAAGSGIVYLFGGNGYDSTGNSGLLNDFWQLDMTTMMWTWIGGSDTRSDSGYYGIKGVPDALNLPAAREGACAWIDYTGDFWLFGGYGTIIGDGPLNDLWRFDGTYWTWMSGAAAEYELGTYGAYNTEHPLNSPGARENAACWTNDAQTELYLFGGEAMGSESTYYSYINDVWKFNVVSGQWVWINGSTKVQKAIMAGSRGEYAPAYLPGGRYGSVTWRRSGENNPYLFGGYGSDKLCHDNGCGGYLNDLWRMDAACQTKPLADLNDDCAVNLEDWVVFSQQWLADGS